MSKKEPSHRDYCTLVDEIGKRSKDFLDILTKHCMTSLVSNPKRKKTVLLPTKTALSKLKKMKPAEQETQIRLHILNRAVAPDTASAQELAPMIKGLRIKIDKAAGKKQITVEGGKATCVAETRTGNLYEIDGLIKAKESVSTTRGRGRQYYGGALDQITLEQFTLDKSRYPLNYFNMLGSQYPMNSDTTWAMFALAPLIKYLDQNIANANEILLPWLDTNPLTTLELLLQIRGSNVDPTLQIITPQMWSDFTGSPYYMSDSMDLVNESRAILNSWCMMTGDCDYAKFSTQRTFIEQNRNYIKNIFNQAPQQARDEITQVYRKLGDINRYSPGQTALFRKVWQSPTAEIGPYVLQNDLMRFMSNRFSMLPYPSYDSYMSRLFPSGMDVSMVIENILQPSSSQKIFDVSGYNFSDDVIIDWLDSSSFLHAFPVDMQVDDYWGYTPFTTLTSGLDPGIVQSVEYTSSSDPFGTYDSLSLTGNLRQPSLSSFIL